MPTFSPDSLLAVRFHNARPGLELVAIIDAGLPVALITADILAQDRKRLPLLDEFVLRLVNNKVTSEPAITGLLGLSERMVNQTVAEQFSADYLTYTLPTPGSPPGARNLRLTARGDQPPASSPPSPPYASTSHWSTTSSYGRPSPTTGTPSFPEGKPKRTGSCSCRQRTGAR